MGEAKTRKLIDPFYGMKPKKGRGILLSAPLVYDERSVLAQSSSIDPVELRRAVLFWDRLVWPDSKIISFGSSRDEEFLEKEGILSRPRPTRFNDEAGVGGLSALFRIEGGSEIHLQTEQASYFAKQHLEEYLDLEKAEPGLWVMASGEGSFLYRNERFVRGRGQLLALTRAIPLPNATFPLEELLEFKDKRMSEIVALNHELERLYLNIARSSDSSLEFEHQLRVVDRACYDMLRTARESKYGFHWGSLELSFSLDSLEAAANRSIAWAALAESTIGLSLVGGIAGAAASCLSTSMGFGLKGHTRRDTPFSVIAKLHEELK